MSVSKNIPRSLQDIVSNNEINIDLVDFSHEDNCLSTFLGQETSQKNVYLVCPPTVIEDNVSDLNESKTIDSPKCQPEVFEETNMMGSPLRLETIANLSVSDLTSSSPAANSDNKKKKSNKLSLPVARKLLSKFLTGSTFGTHPTTLLCLCDGEDKQKTVLIGASKDVIQNRVVTKCLSITSSKVHQTSLEEKSTFNKSQDYHMKSCFKILDKDDGLGSIVLEVNWSDKLGRVKIQHLDLAQFILHVSVTFGSDQSPVHSHYCSLEKVKVFLNSLKTGEISALLTNKPVDGPEKLLELFSKIKAGLIEAQSSSENHGLLSGVTKILRLEQRSDLDFTDMLWIILSKCPTFKEIVHCLNMTFLELRKQELQFFVHSDNQTTLAKLVRQSYSGIAAFPSLTGRLPLLIVAELGLEFIRKNYLAILLNNKLCTKEEWASFIHDLTPSTSAVMDMEELSISLSHGLSDALTKLHHCLELLTIVDAFTERQDLRAIVAAVMNYYRTNHLDTDRTFSFPITALQASPEMNKNPMYSFRRECVSDGTSVVENVLSEYPEALGSTSLSVSMDQTSIVDREYFYFKTQESLHYLQKV